MVLRLDPTVPAVWRTPTSLQFGVSPVHAVLDDVGIGVERMISALEIGTTRRALEVLGGVDAAHRLLAALGPTVHDASTERDAVVHPEIRIRSGSIEAIRAQLLVLVPGATPGGAPGAIRPGLLVVDHVVAPSEHLGWMRADRTHLAVVLGEASIVVGPLVRPGRTACLRCRDLHRRDADPAWPAIATQLLDRPAASGTAPILLAEALSLGIRALMRGTGPAAETAVRILADGERVLEALEPHPECGCFGLVD
jgi:hypothetical protein